MDCLARCAIPSGTVVGLLVFGVVMAGGASAGAAEPKGAPVDASANPLELCPRGDGTDVKAPVDDGELSAEPCEPAETPRPPAEDPSSPKPPPGPSRPGAGGIDPPALGGPGGGDGNGGAGDAPGGGRDDGGRDGPRKGSGGTPASGGRDRSGAGGRHQKEEPSVPSAGAAVADPPDQTSEDARIPSFLVPIYRECGTRYGIPWQVLAAINEIESAFGTNMGPSTAGAIGWMQFLPSTWAAYGVDADRDGRRNPYDADDAICAAARYLRASGARRDLRGAIFAYNHAGWYVDAVIALVRSYTGIAVRDPLPRAKRLDPDFARDLARVAHRHDADWALVLAVLRARGERGRVPASLERVRALAERLSDVGSARDDRLARRVDSELGGRGLPTRQVIVLARFNHAVGLRGLIIGLHGARNGLERRVLDSKQLEIYPGGRDDISDDRIDVRVLTLLLYLAERHDEVTVTSLTTGHGYYARPGVPSAHSFGQAVDIAAVDGKPILGDKRHGGITEQVVRRVLRLPRELRPAQVISLVDLGGPSFAASDHDDHIHVGF
jgi:hypothetical protein